MAEPLIVEFPLRGEWRVMQPPGHPAYAFDLLAVKGERQDYVSTGYLPWVFGMQGVEEWYGWGQPIHAPFDGLVVQVHDGVPDRTPINLLKDMLLTIPPITLFAPRGARADLSPFAGNYALLQAGSVYALLAHFRLHSPNVRPGQTVKAGQQLAEVGVQAIRSCRTCTSKVSDGPNLFTAHPIPFRVSRFDRWTKPVWKSMRAETIAVGDIVRVSDGRAKGTSLLPCAGGRQQGLQLENFAESPSRGRCRGSVMLATMWRFCSFLLSTMIPRYLIASGLVFHLLRI